MKERGKLIICSAPSGSGKTTLVQYLLDMNLNLCFSVSATTRKPRGIEVDGQDYHFLNLNDFKTKIEDNEFVEWEEVYEGIYYGTLKSEVDKLMSEGKNVVFDVDVIGGINLKDFYKEDALSIFIAPPSIIELERRLYCRATDEKCVISERIKKAEYELSFKDKFDKIIINENLDTAKQEILSIVKTFLHYND